MTRVHFSVVGTRHAGAFTRENLIKILDATPRVGEIVLPNRHGVPFRVCRVVHHPDGTDEYPISFVWVELEDED